MFSKAAITRIGSVSQSVNKRRFLQRRYLNRLLFESDEITTMREYDKDLSFGVLNEADSRYKHIEKVIYDKEIKFFLVTLSVSVDFEAQGG
jgi:hypothetical protein